jgi:hypothetical protein
MSAVLLRRRGKGLESAMTLLKPYVTAPEERDNIAVLSNYATAQHFTGDLLGAFRTLDSALKDHWKQPWDDLSERRRGFLEGIGWSQRDYEFYRDCDSHYAKLLRLRLLEQRNKKASPARVQPPDAIFDDGKDPPSPVRFVNESGDFAAGKIAAAEKAKLPAGALPIVQQLVVWMPDDLRLYWLLGELYNAQGGKQGIFAAYQIFADLQKEVDSGRDKAVSDDTRSQLNRRIGLLEAAKADIEAEEARKFNDNFDKTDKQNTTGLQVDWRTVAVSFGVGFLLALFIIWQVREIQRRRMARNAVG